MYSGPSLVDLRVYRSRQNQTYMLRFVVGNLKSNIIITNIKFICKTDNAEVCKFVVEDIMLDLTT